MRSLDNISTNNNIEILEQLAKMSEKAGGGLQ